MSKYEQLDTRTNVSLIITEKEFKNFFEDNDIRTYSKFYTDNNKIAYKGEEYIFTEI